MTVALAGLVEALIYTRVSTADQKAEGVSLDEQIAAARAYVAARPGWIIRSEHTDVQTGTNPTRAQYQAMLAEARALKAEKRLAAVVVKFQDRLGRNMLEALRAYVELSDLGVEVHVAASNGVPTELEYGMRALIAQEESRNISRRIKATFGYFAARRWHKPGSLAWGYRLRPATAQERAEGSPKNVPEHDEGAAPYVREAWERQASGSSVREIAVWVAGLPASARGGRNLGYNAVRKALRAPVYVGRLGSYDEDDPDGVLDRPLGRWPAIVDDDVWRRSTAQRALGARMPRQASGDYPLTGLMRCSRCGSRMSGRLKGTQGGTREARREYICHAGLVLGAVNGERRCLMTVRADVIERPILRTIRDMLDAAGDPDVRQRIVRALGRRTGGAAVEDGERRIAALDAERTKTLNRMHALTSMRADGEIDAESYRASSGRYRDELDRLDGELATQRGRAKPRVEIAPLVAMLGSVSGWARAIESAEGPELRQVLGRFLESVSPVRLGRGAYEPDYTWTATGHELLAASIEATRESRGAAAAERRLHLVRVGNLARAKLSTLTILDGDDRDLGDSEGDRRAASA